MFLQVNHPDYQNLKIDGDNLLTLSKDGPVTDQLLTHKVNKPLLSNFNDSLTGQDMNTDLNKSDNEIQLP